MQFEGLCNFSIFLRACTPFLMRKDSEKIVIYISLNKKYLEKFNTFTFFQKF
jgi:hypothetical protein